MTRLADLAPPAIERLLADPGLSLDFGSARARIRARVPALARAVQQVYGVFEHDAGAAFHDVTVRMDVRAGPRRLFAPQVEMSADAEVLFEPFPAATHLPLLEWGINFLLAQRLHHRLLLHAGVVEVGGRGVVMPALPGTGKSTLTAALVASGARLLSDEFGVVDLERGLLWPMVRPVSLKNASIDVVARFAPGALIGPRFEGTRKGTVAHLAPDANSFAGRHRPATPSLVVFPRYAPGAPLRIEPMSKARALVKLTVNSFNYEVLGPEGFDAVTGLLRACDVVRLHYGDLASAVGAIGDLAGRTRAAA